MEKRNISDDELNNVNGGILEELAQRADMLAQKNDMMAQKADMLEQKVNILDQKVDMVAQKADLLNKKTITQDKGLFNKIPILRDLFGSKNIL